MFQYDEAAIIERVGTFPLRLRVVFGLLAALRILPTYERFHAKTGRGDPFSLCALVERLWQDLSGEMMTDGELRRAVDRAMELVPSEQDGWDEESQPYAEDAAAAITYVLRARLTGDPQEAAWAARRVYEAADHFALATSGLNRGEPCEQTILAHPVIQAELTRQARDLGELADLAISGGGESRLSQMRVRSEYEASKFFEQTE